MKNFIKKILRFFGWKLTKIKIRKPKSYAFGKPELQDFECINSASGILHLGGHRGVEAAAYNWLIKKYYGWKPYLNCLTNLVTIFKFIINY